MPSLCRLLIVDDEREIAELLRYTFETRGHHVMTAHDFATAKALLEVHAFDLLITDFRLPERESGLDLIRLARSGVHPPRTVLITGLPDIQTRPEDLALIDHVAHKPFNHREVLSWVETPTA